MSEKQKKLSEKQRLALELLTCGEGLTYKQIAERVGVNQHTLWDWRNEPQFTHFQDELKRLNDARWAAAIDAAHQAAIQLCKDGKTEMVKFVLQNAGYNPTQKIEADVNQDIIISVGFDEEETNE